MLVYSSTQHPTEVQHIVAQMLGAAAGGGDRRGAPHGRRLRRQGEPGGAMGGDRRARRARHRPPVQAAARPRRRHGHDRQAPRLPRRLRVGFDETGRSDGYDVDCSRRAAAVRRICPAASSTARCSTPTTPISCRQRPSSAAPEDRTRSPTPPSAASAGRRACWRSSA